MKQRTTLSIALVMSIALLSLMGFASPANAAPLQYVADTGIMTLGPNQMLRLTVVPSRDVLPQDTFTFNFEQIKYEADSGDFNFYDCRVSYCMCLHTATSQTRSDNVTLKRGQMATIAINRTPNSGEVRGLIHSNSPDMEVNAEVVDVITGATLISRDVKVFDGSNGG